MKKGRKAGVLELVFLVEVRPRAGLIISSAHLWGVELEDEGAPGDMADCGQPGP